MTQKMERAENFLKRLDDSPVRSNEVDRRFVTLAAPASFTSEQYRSLLYQIERIREARPAKTIALTSALPREGKTVTSVNLALSAVRANPERKVLLIDGDLRRRQLANVLGVRARPGLSEVLHGECALNEAVRRFRSTRLNVLTSGEATEDVGAILSPESLNGFLTQSKAAYDEIYIDLPPALPFVDASLFGRACDGVVLVVRANQTAWKWVAQAMEKLAGASLLGCVLNAAEDSVSRHFKDYFR